MRQRLGDGSVNAREAILAAARRVAQAHGYGGLNFRDLAAEVGIKSASVYYHFPSKAELGAAVARRYWEDSAAELEDLLDANATPLQALHAYPSVFRRSLASGNRLCLCSFMAAEYDDLPEEVKHEVQSFADAHLAWLSRTLAAADLATGAAAEARARAIFAAVAGAQLLARSRADVALFDALIAAYRATGPLPGEGSPPPPDERPH